MAEKKQRLEFWVTPAERLHIIQKMQLAKCTSLAAYLRRMALHGYVVNLELPELREGVSLLRRLSNNINQIARRANETGRVYDADLAEIQSAQTELWSMMKQIITKLASID